VFLVFSSLISHFFSLSPAREFPVWPIIAKVERRCDLDSPEEEDSSPRARLREFPWLPLSAHGSVGFDTIEQRRTERPFFGCVLSIQLKTICIDREESGDLSEKSLRANNLVRLWFLFWGITRSKWSI